MFVDPMTRSVLVCKHSILVSGLNWGSYRRARESGGAQGFQGGALGFIFIYNLSLFNPDLLNSCHSLLHLSSVDPAPGREDPHPLSCFPGRNWHSLE